MDDYMIGGTVVASAWWRPMVHYVGAQVLDELGGREIGISAGYVVGQPREVEVASA
jgi:hypothetical protein